MVDRSVIVECDDVSIDFISIEGPVEHHKISKNLSNVNIAL